MSITYALQRASLAHKVVAISLACLLCLSMTLLGVVHFELNSYAERLAVDRQEANMRVAWKILGSYGNTFQVRDGKLYAGEQALNGLFAPVDEIKRLVGGNATVFLGDERITTNLHRPDDSRAVGTRLAAGIVYDTVLKQGRSFRGEAEILGRPFFTAYDPIKDADGRVVGILFVGIARSEFFAPLDKLRIECATLTLGITLLLGLVCLMVARRMFRPLNLLRGAADCLSRGELGTDVPFASRSDDIGRLAQALLALRSGALEKQRIEAVAAEQARARELEHRTEEERRAAHLGEQRTVVESLATALEQLSEGNLRYRIETPFAAGYDKLRTDFNAAVAKLAGTLGAIATAADAIRTATAGINAGAGTLAGHTQEQAARLQETSSTLGRIAAQVDETAGAVDATRKSVDAARDIAEQSGSVVSNATAAMSHIEGSSRQIQQIIGVIDEIAFQTNLLALNAAVEAARAGEQGRGFAVVAGEVRNLASRSSEAAQQVKDLITQSTQQVAAGTSLVRDTGAALERIVTQVKEISSMVRDVTGASIAHAKEIRTVDGALRELDALTAQNVTMVDDSARASHTAARQAQDLMQRIAQFRIGAANSGAGATQYLNTDDAAAA